MQNKANYIASRYLSKPNSSKIRYINAYHESKRTKILKPFTAFYPIPLKVKKPLLK